VEGLKVEATAPVRRAFEGRDQFGQGCVQDREARLVCKRPCLVDPFAQPI
jgi:hypothetical protein